MGSPPALSKCLCSSCGTQHVLVPCGEMPALSILLPRTAEGRNVDSGINCKPQTSQRTFEKVLTDLNETPLHVAPSFSRNACSLCPPLEGTGWHAGNPVEESALACSLLCPGSSNCFWGQAGVFMCLRSPSRMGKAGPDHWSHGGLF